MKVILVKTLEKVGKEGDVVEVKDGFGRNFLIAKGLAVKATKDSFREIDEIKKRKIKLNEKVKKDALTFKEKIDAFSLTVTMEAKDSEELYGSVSEAQILKALKEEGIALEKGMLVIEEPIKKLGVYHLKVILHPEVEGSLRLWVMKK
ncbi:MAG: 50S ribosomal protein L9 [Candidatus Omnitrophota bacterium]